MVSDVVLASFAFGAGMLAFLNPCGFAMLPSYVALYMGRASQGGETSPLTGALKGLGLGALVTAGFVGVFGSTGLVFSYVGTSLVKYIPWIALLIGGALIVLGASTLLGVHLYAPALIRTIKSPREARPVSFGLAFGVAYGVASLSCTVPLFLLVVLNALAASGFLGGVAVYLSYALGMGLMMVLLSIATAMSHNIISELFHSLSRYVDRISGLVLAGAGVYIIYFQVFLGGILTL
ncbi:MAG: cytochrome c biogenesis CcdA family protein [Candidatus Geothermarchaeales archaeon]